MLEIPTADKVNFTTSTPNFHLRHISALIPCLTDATKAKVWPGCLLRTVLGT